jgi:hypothetical protein
MSNVFERTQGAASMLIVRSALNPVLWLTAIITPVCFVASLLYREDYSIRNILIVTGIAPVVLVIFAYIFFMLFDRDRLHSEQFQLKKLNIIRGKTIGELKDGEFEPSVTNPKLEKIDKK